MTTSPGNAPPGRPGPVSPRSGPAPDRVTAHPDVLPPSEAGAGPERRRLRYHGPRRDLLETGDEVLDYGPLGEHHLVHPINLHDVGRAGDQWPILLAVDATRFRTHFAPAGGGFDDTEVAEVTEAEPKTA